MAYTDHGHHIPGTPEESEPIIRARCGDPGICAPCSREAALSSPAGIGHEICLTCSTRQAREPAKVFEQLRGLAREYEPSRERELFVTNLKQAEFWLNQCVPALDSRLRYQPSTDFPWSPRQDYTT